MCNRRLIGWIKSNGLFIITAYIFISSYIEAIRKQRVGARTFNAYTLADSDLIIFNFKIVFQNINFIIKKLFA